MGTLHRRRMAGIALGVVLLYAASMALAPGVWDWLFSTIPKI